MTEMAAKLVDRMDQVPPLEDSGEFAAVMSDAMRAYWLGTLTDADMRAVTRAASRKNKQGREALAAMKNDLRGGR